MTNIEVKAPVDGLTDELLERTLKLSREDRELLLFHLKESLEIVENQEEIDAAWGVELQRRLDDVNQGKVVLVDAFESLDRLMEARRSKRGT